MINVLEDIVMGKAKAISLKLLLHDGTINGITTIRNDEWVDGEIILGGRENAASIASTSHKGGAYILFSKLSCAVFALEDLEDNVQQHLSQEKWWLKIAVVTTQNKRLAEAESYALTSILKRYAHETGSLLYDDGDEHEELDAFQKVFLEQFASSAIELLTYCDNILFSNEYLKDTKSTIDLVEGKPGTYFAKSGRKDAKDYLLAQGVVIKAHYNYAVKREVNGAYWFNANVENLTKDWSLIFNDTDLSELIVATIPAYSLMIGSKNKPGLTLRQDKNCIDIEIDSASFVDRKSGVDFAPFLTMRVKYVTSE